MATINQSKMDDSGEGSKLDTGLLCLATVASFFNVPVNVEQLRLAFVVNEEVMSTTSFLLAAKKLSLKARLTCVDAEKLPYLPLPTILILKSGNYVVLMRTEENNFLLYDPYYKSPITISKEQFLQAWSGQVILIAKHFQLKDLGKEFNLSWFIPVFWRYRGAFNEVIVASFFLQFMGLVSPLFTQVIIDKVLVHRGLATLDILVIGIVVVTLFNTMMGILRNYLFTHTTNKVDVILGAKLFQHITALPLRYFELRRVGDTVARVRELENIRQFISGSALTVVLDTFFAIVFIVVMFIYNTVLSIVALLALPIYITLSVIVTPIYRRQLQEQFTASAENHSYLVETITGIQTIKSLGVEPKFRNRWEDILSRYVKISFDTGMTASVANNISQCVQTVFNIIILWYGARLVMDGKLTVGQLIAFQMLAGQVSAPVLRLVNLWQSFQQARVSIERLGDILNTPMEPTFYTNRSTLPALRGDIHFENVSFRYRHDGSKILDEVNINIRASSRIGIVGRSGSGKSTITKMIQRLYAPESGRILLDGVDLAHIDLNWLRKQIGVVLQDSFLFNGTIRENIAITKPTANMNEIVKAAQLAGAHEFILELHEGYDTHVGERGTALSGGQKQRIAIARTLLTNPRVIIFDEATSALDYESERTIMANMDKICAGRTVIIIAHRLSLVKGCDNIFVVDVGKIVEQGSHLELMNKKGLYYHLNRQQEGLI